MVTILSLAGGTAVAVSQQAARNAHSKETFHNKAVFRRVAGPGCDRMPSAAGPAPQACP
jgi:hypothetical protein